MNIKSTLLGLVCLLCFTTLFAQESISLNVTYEFSYVRDLESKEVPYTANMILSLGKQSSRYCTEKLYMDNNKRIQDEKKKQQEQASASPQPMTVVSGGPLLIVNKHGAIINEEIVKNVPAKTLALRARLAFKSYVVESELPAINWTMQSDKKKIGQYDCQKATGAYGGRTYTAWFAPDLPFQDGPWKLSGLPGLILEATDDKQEVSFRFKELSKNTNNEETTGSLLQSTREIKTDAKSYVRTKEAFETDPESVMAAMAPNAKLAVKNLDDPQAQHASKIKKYNPLEHVE